jgi:hypothetical protein
LSRDIEILKTLHLRILNLQSIFLARLEQSFLGKYVENLS